MYTPTKPIPIRPQHFSALDTLSPNKTETIRSQEVEANAKPSEGSLPKAYPLWLYGRGPGTLRSSLIKTLVLLTANMVLVYAILCLVLLCWWRNMCFVEENTGAPLGSSRLMYSGAVSRAIVPVALVLICVIYPGVLLSVRLQLPWMLGTSWVLTSLSAAFLAIVSTATFALLGNGGINTASGVHWSELSLATRTLSYANSQENLTREMKADAAATAVASLAGAVVTGLSAMALTPFARVVFWALHTALKGWWLERKGGGGGGGEPPPPPRPRHPGRVGYR